LRTDTQSGLVYYGRRFYVPILGHWLTPDPKGFTDELNLYAFVHNAPLTCIDLYGLSAVPTWNQPLIAWGTPQLLPSMFNKALEFQPLPEICPAFSAGSGAPLSFYVNGIQNERNDGLAGAEGLFSTLRGRATVVPAYDPTLGKTQDLMSVNAMIAARKDGKPYTSDFITLFRKTLRDAARFLEANNDPRKIFIVAFSRGAGSVYHTVNPMTLEERNRLIIVACGPIMMLPRRLGFQVANLISKGDPYSGFLNSEMLENREKYRQEFDIQPLDQLDGFSGFQRDHFFLSKTYQEGIWRTFKSPLEEFRTTK
jgi:RHS repeat-associated protein